MMYERDYELRQYINKHIETIKKDKSIFLRNFIQKDRAYYKTEIDDFKKKLSFYSGEIAGLKYAISLLANNERG